ncbi:MAG: hypothetical protein ACJ8I3_28195 [Paraburkholderia graminis]
MGNAADSSIRIPGATAHPVVSNAITVIKAPSRYIGWDKTATDIVLNLFKRARRSAALVDCIAAVMIRVRWAAPFHRNAV